MAPPPPVEPSPPPVAAPAPEGRLRRRLRRACRLRPRRRPRRQPGRRPPRLGSIYRRVVRRARNSNDEPIYKKWWLWAGVGAVVVGVVVDAVVVLGLGELRPVSAIRRYFDPPVLLEVPLDDSLASVGRARRLLDGRLGFGCKKSGTFAVLDFATAPQGLKSIGVDLTLGAKMTTTTFTGPGGSDITLPTSATLEIGSGTGTLVRRHALDGAGAVLATGHGQGAIASGDTIHIAVTFGATTDGGAGDGGTTDGAGGSGGGTGGGGVGGNDGGAGDATDGGSAPAPPRRRQGQVRLRHAGHDGIEPRLDDDHDHERRRAEVGRAHGERGRRRDVSSRAPIRAAACRSIRRDGTLTIKFQPAASGVKSSTLTASATPGGTATVMLTGTAVDPARCRSCPTTRRSIRSSRVRSAPRRCSSCRACWRSR